MKKGCAADRARARREWVSLDWAWTTLDIRGASHPLTSSGSLEERRAPPSPGTGRAQRRARLEAAAPERCIQE